MAAGFTVPPAFAVNTDAFRLFLAENGLEEEIKGLLEALTDRNTAKAIAVRLSARLLEATMPEALRSELTTAYEALAERGGPACVVRSSATSEDGSAASFAGLFETYLNVRGAHNVLSRVQDCYASLWSERTLSYFARVGADAAPEMAVVVMTLVPAETAGVIFTAHPVTGAIDQVVINATWGLGESVVSGAVTPDSFTFDKATLAIVERRIEPKTVGVFPSDSGTAERELDEAVALTPSLDEDTARKLVALACQVESRFGAPQDIEFAMANGQVYLLQSRPVTYP
jgi:pyruvate,water dikinase